MATKLTTPLKREIEVDGKLYTLAVTSSSITITEKRHRAPLLHTTWAHVIDGARAKVEASKP